MELVLSEEQQELAATVRSLLAKRADSQAVRAAAQSATGYDVGLWEMLAEQIGAAAVSIPEAYGGVGLGLFEGLVMLEELGASLAPSPLLTSLITAEAVLAAGDPATSEQLLPRIAAGEVATLAWSGPTAATTSAAPSLTETQGRLSGTVEHVLYGDQASVLLVVAETGTGAGLFQVDPARVERTWRPAMDTTMRLARLDFDQTPATRVAGDARAAARRADLVGTVGVAALAVGCAQRALDMTVAYAKDRVQFGRPIGSFQALKHRMADMLVLLEMSRSASLAAGLAVSADTADAPRLTAVAASYTKDALARIAAETVQLHGGVAITWEHDAQMVFKRAHALCQLFGPAHRHRATLV